MAFVSITIKDSDANNIMVDVNMGPKIPESRLLWTNSQMIAMDILAYLQQLSNQINNREHQSAVKEAIRLDNLG